MRYLIKLNDTIIAEFKCEIHRDLAFDAYMAYFDFPDFTKAVAN